MALTKIDDRGLKTPVDLLDNEKIRLGTGNDLELYHDGSNSVIKEAGTGDLRIQTASFRLRNEDASEMMISADANGAVYLAHNGNTKLETLSNGVRIFSEDGAEAVLEYYADRGDQDADKFRTLASVNADWYVQNYYDGSWETNIKVLGGGAVELYHNNDKKFDTVAGGTRVFGYISMQGTGGHIYLPDEAELKIGSGEDLKIYHNGSYNYIVGNSSSPAHIYIRPNSSEEAVCIENNGACKFAYDGSFKFETTSSGATCTGWLQGTQVYATDYIKVSDSDKIYCGSDNDLQLFHDGTHSWVHNNTGILYLGNASGSPNDVRIQAKYGEESIVCNDDGSVELYHDNSKIAETWSGGLRITGAIKAVNSTADSHWGTDSSTWSQFQTLSANNVAIFENSHDSTPYGNYLYFSDAAPDNNVQYYIQCDDNSASRIKMYSDGDIWTSDAGTLTSDETLKENITDATSKLEDLKKLKVRNFYWKASFHPEKSKKKQLGFIAQEVETVFPNLIQEHDVAIGIPGDDHTPVMKKSIKQAWAPILVKALQEAVAKIETLETKVAALEAK